MRCYDAKVPVEATAALMGIRNVQIVIDHYRQMDVDHLRVARASLSRIPLDASRSE